jgi:hypothetical protein
LRIEKDAPSWGYLEAVLGNFRECEAGRIIWEEALAKLAVTFTNAIHSKSKDRSILPIAKTT